MVSSHTHTHFFSHTLMRFYSGYLRWVAPWLSYSIFHLDASHDVECTRTNRHTHAHTHTRTHSHTHTPVVGRSGSHVWLSYSIFHLDVSHHVGRFTCLCHA